MTPDNARKRRPRERLALRQRRDLFRLLAVLADTPAHQEKPAGWLSRALDWASGHFNLLAGAAVVLAFLGAWVLLGVSPLHPLKKIANEQIESDRQEAKRKFVKAVVKRRLKMGNELLNDGLYELAGKEFDEALHLDQNDLEAELGKLKSKVYDLGGEYNHKLFEKRVIEIEQWCKEVKNLKTNADVHEEHAWMFRGDWHARATNFGEAINCFDKVVKINNNVAYAYYKLGYLYKNRPKPDHDQSLKNYATAVEKSEWDRRYLNDLASQYAKMDNRKNAIINFRKAIMIAPDYILPYLELSDIFRRENRLPIARNYLYDAVILLDDQRVTALSKNKGGWVFDCDSASMRVTLGEVSEKQAYAYLSMALTLHLLDQKPESLSYLEKARRLKLKTMSRVLSVVRRDCARLPEHKIKSDFLEILKREMSTSD